MLILTILYGCSRDSNTTQYKELTPEIITEEQQKIEAHSPAISSEAASSVILAPASTNEPPPVSSTSEPKEMNPPASTSNVPPAVSSLPPIVPTSSSTAMLPTSSSDPSAALDTMLEPREPKLLIPNKTFTREGGKGVYRVTFDDIDLLKVLNMEPVPEDAPDQFPDWLKELDGQRVLIRGFMFPTLSRTGIKYFQHVRDNEICCFGRTPKVYDRISTILDPDHPTNYIQGRPFDVEGTFRIDPVYEDGEWLQLYLLDDAIVIDR